LPHRSNVSGFRSFLIKNFTVKEYFERRARDEAPFDILKSKGYVLGHIRKWLIEAGLPPSPEGQAEFSRRQEEARRAPDERLNRLRRGIAYAAQRTERR
jgi:hypothetical protein